MTRKVTSTAELDASDKAEVPAKSSERSPSEERNAQPPKATDLAKLPDPDDFPGRAVVLFDGQCRFCQAQVRRLHTIDLFGRLTFLSLHDPRVVERYPDLTHEQLMEQMYVVPEDGRRLGGVLAFRYLSRVMPTLWWLAPGLHLPGTFPLWSWAYSQVARRRYMFGKVETCTDGACEVHFQKRHK